MPQLTIFTPTYNRKGLLRRCFDSLLRQTNMDFIWLVIDDGSRDGTEEAVREWAKECDQFEIRYVRKENEGLHTGYNKAIELLDTELAMCLDSDDWLPENAVERILAVWRDEGSNEFAGIVGLHCTRDGRTIGDPLPAQKSINLIDLMIGKYKINNGDRKNIVRSDLYRQVAPMRVFPGEKNFNPHYMHILISRTHDFLVLNENLCYTEYQPAGMSATMYWQYWNSPRSFAEIRKLNLSLPGTTWAYRFRQQVHYASSCFLAGEGLGLGNMDVITRALAYLPGWLLSRLILYKNRDRARGQGGDAA